MGNIVKKILITIIRMLPLRNDIILESHPDFSDNSLAFYEFLLSQGVNKRVKIHWGLHRPEEEFSDLPEGVDTFALKARGLGQQVKRLKILYRSRYIVDSNSYIKKRRKGQIRIHLGHGMLIKITRGYHGYDQLGEVDGYLTMGANWKDVFTGKLGIPEDKLLPLGYPRDDIFQKKMEKDFGDYLVWLPTFRQHRDKASLNLKKTYPFGMPEVETEQELEALERALEDRGLTLYFRPHPAQDLSAIDLRRLPHIVLADDQWLREEKINLYQVLAGAKGLITDYSSVYFDFLALQRPIALTCSDSQDYFATYGCAFDHFEEEVLGYRVEDFDHLLGFLDQVVSPERELMKKMKKMMECYQDYPQGGACQRLYDYMREHYDFDQGR
ncbi:MAG: CDP-glycerol glycerophosphotransferase family protein [Eubacterium sp.]|nr:CDP-glycerol glycerophosphotransferase family protein [Eubacterium sp.]